MSVAHQLAGDQQHRNLVAVAQACGRIAIHIDDIDRNAVGCRQRGQFGEHFLTERAAGPRIQQESQWEGGSLPR